MTNVKRADIESIEPSKVSPMPEGLLNSLQLDEIQDLVAYLLPLNLRLYFTQQFVRAPVLFVELQDLA